MRRIFWWAVVALCAWVDLHTPAPSGVSMAIAPLLLAGIIAAAAGTAVNAGVNSKNQRDTRDADTALTREQIAQREKESLRDTAAAEATQNPFRDQVHQAQSLGRLDLMARSQLTPTKITPHARYASAVPARTGGLSYEMDPQVRAMAERLKLDVASGRGAPTMTNAANYGKTGAVDLLSALGLPALPAPARQATGALGVSFDRTNDRETVATRLARLRADRAEPLAF